MAQKPPTGGSGKLFASWQQVHEKVRSTRR